jgi:hypothetical protein
MRLLEAEGVTPIEAMGQPFTPDLHEAVTTIAADAEAGTVVEELEPGYRLSRSKFPVAARLRKSPIMALLTKLP